MKRREFIFISILGGLIIASARVSRAQAPAIPVVGFLSGESPGGFSHLVAAFREGLKEAGYVEERNVAIEFRWGEGRSDRLPALASELVQRRVSVIAAGGGSDARRAAKAATKTIPVVFAMGGDPVKEGLVASLSRPGGNVTGVSFLTNFLEGKRLGLIWEVVPPPASVAVLIDTAIFASAAAIKDVQSAAAATGRRVHILKLGGALDIESSFGTLPGLRVGGLLVTASPLFNSRRTQLVGLAARMGIPAIYESREFVDAGGLMSYGASIANGYREMGIYVGKILNGTMPADLPVLQSKKTEFVINLGTARALGLTIPQSVLLRADDVIQ